METKARRVTKVIDRVEGKWLEEAIQALGVSVTEAAKAIGLDVPRRLHQHISNESHLGGGYLCALKYHYPAINMNYVLLGELPILVKKETGEHPAIGPLERSIDFISREIDYLKKS